jgi:hypothetical protein
MTRFSSITTDHALGFACYAVPVLLGLTIATVIIASIANWVS